MITVRSRATALAAAGALAAAVIGATATGASAAVPACGNSSLAISNTTPQGATGHDAFVLEFRNASAATCSLTGYPGFDALTASGVALAHAIRTLHGFAGGAHAVTTVSITPGRYASATVEWMNFNPTTGGACSYSHGVATTAPNTTRTVRLPLNVSVCLLQVHPTVPGATGNG